MQPKAVPAWGFNRFLPEPPASLEERKPYCGAWLVGRKSSTIAVQDDSSAGLMIGMPTPSDTHCELGRRVLDEL